MDLVQRLPTLASRIIYSCCLVIAPITLVAQDAKHAYWVHLAQDTGYEYGFSQVVLKYPYVSTVVRAVPEHLTEFRKPLPSRYQATAIAGEFSFDADCAKTDATRWGSYYVTDAAGNRVKVSNDLPEDVGWDLVGNSLRARLCRQSERAIPKGWAFVTSWGTDFGEYTAFVDAQSVTTTFALNFRWRLQPKFPVLFAINRGFFATFDKDDEYQFTEFPSTADCKERFLSYSAVAHDDRDGQVFWKADFKDKSHTQAVTAESINAKLLDFVCKNFH